MVSEYGRNLKDRLARVIFEADTPLGKLFDVILIIFIKLSVLAVMLDSVSSFAGPYGHILYGLEWFFTLAFTLEYILRLYCARRPLGYVVSFFGVVDLLAILPTYLSLFLPGGQYLLVIRVLRVLRVFRVLKLVKFLDEANMLMQALRASRVKIFVFLYTILSLVIIFGSLMYIIESEASGFTSIPRSIYWAIVTLTTVGYGDISPITSLGQALASVIMIFGYGIIAVPTGIVTVEMSRVTGGRSTSRQLLSISCPQCGTKEHDRDARYCRCCGIKFGSLPASDSSLITFTW